MKKKGEEDYRFLATIRAGKKSIRNVLCKLFLPFKHLDLLQIHLFPTTDQSDVFEGQTDLQLSHVIRNIAGDRRGKIEARDLFVNKFNRSWGGNTAENIIIAQPNSLTIFEILPPRKNSHSLRVKGRFWLTPSVLLSQPYIPEYHHTGVVRIRRGKKWTFCLNKNFYITINYWHKHLRLDDEGVGTYAELVTEFTTTEAKGVLRKLENQIAIEYLDDFLLISSFAARRRTVCTGWDFLDSKGWTRHYRRGITIPATKKKPHLNEVLIQPEHFKNFASQAYKKLRQLSMKQQEFIRQALHYTIPRENRTLEMTYITYCSAIETLLSLNNEGTEAGQILSSPIWKQLSQELKEFIRSHQRLRSDKVARTLIYEKLPELNRVSFRTSIQRLITHYEVDLTDLWPVTDTGDDISLLGIRNALIHGRTFTDPQRYSLIAAREHLHWTVERLLLGFFEWPTARSTVSKEYLERNLAMHKGWDADRKALSA